MRLLFLPFVLLASSLFAQVQPPPIREEAPPVDIERIEPMEGVTDDHGPEAIPADADAVQEPLTFAEQMPEFPGGQQAMMTYLSKSIRYPEECKEAGVDGRVFIAFVVDREGLVTEVKVLRGVPACPALDREATRAVKAMPKWTPGRQNEQPVSVRMTIPVMFKLAE